MNSPVAPQSLASIKLNLPTQRGVYYGGKWHEPIGGRATDQINPGTGELPAVPPTAEPPTSMRR